MRVLILNADYPRFLTWLYRRTPDLARATYATQMAARNASLFGVADFYSRNFAAAGHVAADIHINNPWMRAAWAREHGLAFEQPPEPGNEAQRRAIPGSLQRMIAPFKPILRPLARKVGLSPRLDAQAEEILLAQIEGFKPDVVLNQDVFHIDARLARQIKGIGRPILIGQVGIVPSRGEDWSAYDLMISQLLRVVESFRSVGVRSEVVHLAFEPDILDRLPPAPERSIDISFVGAVSADHQQRVAQLEAVAWKYDLKLYGSGLQNLPASSPLHRCYQGEVWGVEMYQALRASRLTLNSHIDQAGREAGNARLFEATGAGTFLLTDFKDNLHTLFDIGSEVAAWHTADDCLTLIDRYLGNEDERCAIAAAGQARTVSTHTFRRRIEDILRFVS
ncbi:glycosyltransferase [Bradyrhizobium sp. 40]|uniref:CgeB family protein n=1 Tax=unclassified Bradyrhizobium TaxID=2631580 RepID=UPI001FF795FB|nr:MULTISPECIES: glycosyltransferase [unclassified Bradyrhizobium]MCK1303460.1 glycosyltransferase [Bradyrhizobium sp. 37]MCK1770535.1 glycosyltransferase [Bradyrhizobium sp. 134]UPJ44570.1 glycosyltransferase [Bradyrhizobium sp. 40]